MISFYYDGSFSIAASRVLHDESRKDLHPVARLLLVANEQLRKLTEDHKDCVVSTDINAQFVRKTYRVPITNDMDLHFLNDISRIVILDKIARATFKVLEISTKCQRFYDYVSWSGRIDAYLEVSDDPVVLGLLSEYLTTMCRLGVAYLLADDAKNGNARVDEETVNYTLHALGYQN